MSQVNQAIFEGNLTTDVEVNETSKGTKVANFTLANNETYKDSEGNKKSKTTYVKVTVWGVQAVNTAKYRKKGDLMMVTGSLDLDEWTTEEGKKSLVKITATNVFFR